jgi:hypothetical protein
MSEGVGELKKLDSDVWFTAHGTRHTVQCKRLSRKLIADSS